MGARIYRKKSNGDRCTRRKVDYRDPASDWQLIYLDGPCVGDFVICAPFVFDRLFEPVNKPVR
jgi:hypothetical protein